MREKKSTKRKTSGLGTRINFKTKKKDVFLRAINIMTKTTNLKFPMMFAKAVCELEDGGSLEDIINKYSFHQESFIRILKYLKFIMNSSRDKRKLPSLRIRLLLPKIHKSFADMSSQICYVPSTKSSSYKDLRKRLEALSVSRNFQHGSIQRRKNRNTASDLESPSNSQCSSSTQMAQISQISSNKAVKGKATKRSKACKNPQVCLFCHQSGDREVELGKLHSIGKIYVHYYCLLFSSALEQNGQDNEGILGFLAKDILKELKRGEKLKCCYCNQRGATIGCNSKNCKKTYHFPCGLDNFSQFVFKDNFSSMCVKHRKFQQGYNKGKEVECPICMETMIADPKFAVWAPCCRKASWFHKLCIQKLALNAGYFFKCPLCNDKNIFTPEMLAQGIFVPDQDASWELEPNAFQELLERPIRCDVPKCKCPGGRKNDDEGTRWEILLCTLCGSTGTHILCSQLKFNCREWHCTTCVSMLRESALRAQQESRTRRVVGRKRRWKVYDEESPPSSDEEEEEGSSDRKRLRRSSDLPLRSPRPSSSSCRASRDTEDDDDVVSVPEGIRGDLVIRDLVTLEGESSLSDALIEMKSYANSFPNKLAEANFSEGQFLDVINAITSESGGGQAYVLGEEHLRKFIDCSFNYDQMRVLRKSFELFLIIHYLKKNVSRACSRKKNNPFLSSPSRTSFKLKKLKDFQRSLTSNLIKAKSANLFEGNTTWSTYSTPVSKPKKPSCQLNPKEGVTINSTVVSGGDEENEPSSSQSTSYIRRLTVRRLSEKCEFCNMQLNPGTMPTTLFLAAGTLEIICTSCLSCNAFCGIFPKVSPPNAQGVVKPPTEKTTPDKFSANLSKSPKASKVKVATVSNQASICDYFSTRTKVTPSPAKPTTAPPVTSAAKGRNPSCANISSEKKDCESGAKNGPEDSAVCSLSTPKPKAGAVEAKVAVPPPKAHLEEKPVNKAFYEVAPPVHSIMPISNSSIICKCCSMIEVAESERKMSKLYCPCCEDVPSFCSRDHFNLYHTFTHNWLLIPPINGNQKPNKLCKVCKEKKLTRFYCPACPWDVGYCSLAHYKEIHTKEKMLTNRMPTVDFRKKEENLKRERIRDVRIKKDEQPLTEPSSLDKDILQLGKEISQRFQASNSSPDAANSLISMKFPEIPDHANSQRSVKFKEIPDDANSLRSVKFKEIPDDANSLRSMKFTEIPDDANSLRSMKFKEIPDDANSLRSVKFKEIPNDANSLRSVKFKEIPDGENLRSLKKFRITKKEESVMSVPSQKETDGSRSSSSLDDPDLWLKKNQIVSSDSAAAGPLLVGNKAADAPNLVGSVATDEQESKLDSSRLPVTISTSDPQKTQESGSLEHESVKPIIRK